MNDAADRGREIAASLSDGTFEAGQVAARMYATHGEAAERKRRGALEKDIEGMRQESAGVTAVLKKVPEPTKVGSGERRSEAKLLGRPSGVSELTSRRKGAD